MGTAAAPLRRTGGLDEPADLVLAGTTVLDLFGLRRHVDVQIRNGVIECVGPANKTGHRRAGETIDYRDGLILPAYTNAHHHFATGLLRLEPPGPSTASQRERLERFIWPFERRLSREDVRLAVQAGLAEAIRAGTTTIIDHHVSGGCTPGILDVIAEEVIASGARAILCYEVSDRDGPAIAAAALAENERFLRSLDSTDGLLDMVGLHAMSTVGPESLARAIELAQRFSVGLHLHLAESDHDNADSVSRYGKRPVARLAAVRALDAPTLAAHAIHVTPDEVGTLAEHGVVVAHCPRSNDANGVGLINLEGFHAAGILTGLGGDGFTPDMRAEVDLLPLLQRQEQRRSTALPIPRQLEIAIDGSAAIVKQLTGWRTGRVEPGYQADLLGLRYDPVIPLVEQTAMWHYSRGFPGGTLRDVWSRGRRLLQAGQLQTLDEERIGDDLRRYAGTRRSSAPAQHGLMRFPGLPTWLRS